VSLPRNDRPILLLPFVHCRFFYGVLSGGFRSVFLVSLSFPIRPSFLPLSSWTSFSRHVQWSKRLNSIHESLHRFAGPSLLCLMSHGGAFSGHCPDEDSPLLQCRALFFPLDLGPFPRFARVPSPPPIPLICGLSARSLLIVNSFSSIAALSPRRSNELRSRASGFSRSNFLPFSCHFLTGPPHPPADFFSTHREYRFPDAVYAASFLSVPYPFFFFLSTDGPPLARGSSAPSDGEN